MKEITVKGSITLQERATINITADSGPGEIDHEGDGRKVADVLFTSIPMGTLEEIIVGLMESYCKAKEKYQNKNSPKYYWMKQMVKVMREEP